LVVVCKYLVFLKNHRSSPTAVVDRKVNDPLVGGRLCNIVKEPLEFGCRVESVVVKYSHFSDRDNFTTLLKEDWNPNVFGEFEQSVQVAYNFVVGPFLVKLFEVTPESLEWFLICHNIFQFK
jgi:hypothetical protein